MSAINPEGSKFRWQGFDFVFVTEPNHPWKNWLCFKHPDGQWVSLHKCDSSEPIDWQSRALAAEQERDQLKAELQQAREAAGFNPHFDFDDEVRFILGRPGFTVREFAETLRAGGCYQCAKKHEDEQAVAIHWMLTLYRKHGLEWRAKGDAEIRAILERIEKEKPSVN